MPSALLLRAATVLLCGLVVCSAALAQSPVPPGTGTKPSAAAQAEQRREKSAEELAAELKAHRDWELHRRQIVEARAVKRAECRHEADQQHLHLVKRQRFITDCVTR